MSDRGLSPGYRCAHPGYGSGRASHAFALRATARQVAPCSLRPQGKPVLSWSVSPERERAERLAKGRFRDPPASQASSPPPFESQRRTSIGSAFASEVAPAEPGPRKQPFACVPHTDGFVGLLDVPGLRDCASAPRSCVLTPGHALEPSAPSAVVCPVGHRGQEIPDNIRSRQTLRTSASRSTPRDHRCALRIGTGRQE